MARRMRSWRVFRKFANERRVDSDYEESDSSGRREGLPKNLSEKSSPLPLSLEGRGVIEIGSMPFSLGRESDGAEIRIDCSPDGPRDRFHIAGSAASSCRGRKYSFKLLIRGVLLSTIGVALVSFLACNETTKYKTLSFLFDGVPPPGSSTTKHGATPNADEGAPAALAPEAPPRRTYPHPPYRDNRCDGCHDVAGGGLIRPVKEGLCLTCHTKLLEGLTYVHGPVAVRDCTVCHETHASAYPNLLLTDSVSTCLNCHDRSDLSPELHPPDSVAVCVDCHNPHGGANRFFVKREQP